VNKDYQYCYLYFCSVDLFTVITTLTTVWQGNRWGFPVQEFLQSQTSSSQL